MTAHAEPGSWTAEQGPRTPEAPDGAKRRTEWGAGSEASLRRATAADLDAIVALKERVLRADLERLLIWDDEKSRARVVEHFSPEHSFLILVGSETAGTITLRPDGDVVWLEMSYLDAAFQGRGIGTSVLRSVLAETTGPMRLQVLVGSPAQRLYARHGFMAEHDDGIDVWMRRSAR